MLSVTFFNPDSSSLLSFPVFLGVALALLLALEIGYPDRPDIPPPDECHDTFRQSDLLWKVLPPCQNPKLAGPVHAFFSKSLGTAIRQGFEENRLIVVVFLFKLPCPLLLS